MPRDPERIDRILSKLRRVWRRHPDWRLGQLIVNVMGAAESPAIFYPEDDRVEASLDERLLVSDA